LLDLQGHGAGLWLATTGALLLGLPLALRLRGRADPPQERLPLSPDSSPEA